MSGKDYFGKWKEQKNHRVSLSCQPIASKFIHLHPRNSSQIEYEKCTGKTQTSSILSDFLIDSNSIFSPESDAIRFSLKFGIEFVAHSVREWEHHTNRNCRT